jgi:hypothetical protein
MTSFVHLEYSKKHPGVERVESAITAAQGLRRSFTGARGLATLLLSAIVAAVMVVAYQVMDSVAEGHLLVLWIGVWAIAFVVLAGFAATARHLTRQLMRSLDDWSRGIAVAKADQRLWAAAKNDPRVMADLQCAITRNEIYLGDNKANAAIAANVIKSKVMPATLPSYQRSYI